MTKEKIPSPELAIDIMPEQHRKTWEEGRNNLIKRAMTGCARTAESYRKFYVGCSMLSYNANENEYFFAQAGNYKPVEGMQEGSYKRCAERMALEGAAADNDSEVVGMVIASTKIQPELTQGIKSDVLFPCEECRKMFAESPLIKLWTKILLLRLNEEIEKMDMVEFYDNLKKVDDPKKVGELIKIAKEMSYVDFINRIREGKI